ncbi:MAG: hypothetical protein ABIG89_06170 [Candidatus Woesearchaeota archaeon]
MKKSWIMLIIIFFIIAGIRIYFAFQTDQFSVDEAYLTLRQVEHIVENGTPLYVDDLSFGGRVYVFLPLFHYLLALFTKILPIIFAAKILPNILASTIVFFVYMLVYDITKDEHISIFTSIFSAFIPIYFSKTINSISIYSLVVPLIVLLLYLVMNIDKGYNIKYFLVAILIFLLTHTSVIILILSLLVYIILVKIENIKLKRSIVEATLFSAFLMLWLYLIIFKKAFLTHGFSLVWQNMPQKYLITYFHQIPIWEGIYLIGIIPFVLGLFIIYHYLFNLKNRKVYLLISFAITVTCLLWLKLINLDFALICLGVILVILFGIAYNHLNQYIKTTRFSWIERPLFILICIIFVFTSMIPSVILAEDTMAKSLPYSHVQTMIKLSRVIPENISTTRIASSLNEGHAVAYFTKKKNFGDNNFIFMKDADEIVNDIDELYSTVSKIKASEILNKYKIEYVMFTPLVAEEYNTDKLRFVDDECFDMIIDDNINIYKNKCVVIKSIMSG